MRQLRLFALAVGLLWLAAPAAQDSSAPELPWYTVEVVVFAHRDNRGLVEEIWPVDPGLPDTTGAVALTPDGLPLLDTMPGELAPILPAQSGGNELAGIVRALRRSSAYEPLLHVAWRQAGRGKGSALPVLVRSGAAAVAGEAYGGPATAAPTLEGTLRVYLSRYLHLEADLVYRREVPAGYVAPAAEPAPIPAADAPAAAPAARDVASERAPFRLTQSRRMRSNEIHYIDHPIFGIIAHITPYEFPTPEPEAPATPEPTPADSPGPGSTPPAG